MPPAPRLVAFYRAAAGLQIRRVLVLGPSALTLGALVIALSLVAGRLRALRTEAAVAGFLLVAGGAAYTLLGMQRILREDAYVALRTDGLLIQSAGSQTLIAWDDLAEVRWDAPRAELILERAGAPPVVVRWPFARISGPALADAIGSTKRKIAMNLLR